MTRCLRRLGCAPFGAALLVCGATAQPVGAEGVAVGGDLSAEILHTSRDDTWLGNLEGGAWLEADLGELFGADHWYAFVNPTVAWGAEEDWHVRLRLYQAWLAWDGSEHFNALVGLLDPSWHFHSLPSAAPFVRLPTRSGGEFSPGSIGLLDLFPLSAPSVRLEWKPWSHSYVQAAALWLDEGQELRGRPLLDGAAASERWLSIGELGWRDEGDDADPRQRSFGLGGWRLFSPTRSWGAYAFADAQLWNEGRGDAQGVSGFISLSAGRSEGFEGEQRVAVGLSYQGLLPSRPDDTTAAAVVLGNLGVDSDPARDERRWQRASELIHRVQLADGLWLQATLQWQDPQGDAGQADDWRVGLRLGAEF